MKSYTTLRNLFGVDTKNTSAANLSFGDQTMNDYLRTLMSEANWPFRHRLRTVTTVANTTFVDLPYDMDQVESVFVTVSSTRHNPQPAPNRAFWDRLHYSSTNSDIPQYWFVYNGQIGLWPQPSSSGNTVSINGTVRVSDLETADYTTGTIASATNGDETIEGNGPSWTSAMVGRWIKITVDNTAATGDGLWYEIASVTDADTLELVRPYGGTTFSSATQGYTMGQMSLLPESAQDLPEIYAAFRYWAKEDAQRASSFKAMLSRGEEALFKMYSTDDLSVVLDDGIGANKILNPNLTLSL